MLIRCGLALAIRYYPILSDGLCPINALRPQRKTGQPREQAAVIGEEEPVRQLRHHFNPHLARISQFFSVVCNDDGCLHSDGVSDGVSDAV